MTEKGRKIFFGGVVAVLLFIGTLIVFPPPSHWVISVVKYGLIGLGILIALGGLVSGDKKLRQGLIGVGAILIVGGRFTGIALDKWHLNRIGRALEEVDGQKIDGERIHSGTEELERQVAKQLAITFPDRAIDASRPWVWRQSSAVFFVRVTFVPRVGKLHSYDCVVHQGQDPKCTEKVLLRW